MAGRRASKLEPLQFLPGFYTNEADRDPKNRWKDGNRVRFHNGAAEKMGGWERITLTGFNDGVYIGSARALHDWSSLDSQQWIAVGTECKLMLVNNGMLSDITPTRKTSNVNNPFTTTNGSASVLVTDTDNRVEPGDHIFITASSAVGGLTLAGDYEVDSVVSADSFRITATATASSGATGGGGTTIAYNIGCGLASNGELLGWGTGDFGEGTWGTPRPVGSGVPSRLRTWSLDNFGEDLVASPSNGELYLWDRTGGPNGRAMLIPEAPTNIQRLIVPPDIRFVLALGCSGIDGVFDAMLIRWPSQETLTDWFPTPENTAGDLRLSLGSRLITGIASRGQSLVWSDTQLYSIEYIAGSTVFSQRPLGATKIVGPNAAVDEDGIAYWMGFDNFFAYDGVISVIPCDVHTRVFGASSAYRIDKTQAEKVVASRYSNKDEIRWEYPSVAGGGENDSYVIYNRTMKCWYFGLLSRTYYHDVSAAITGYLTNPYAASNGYLYKHEVGTDELEGDSVNPQDWFLESYDANIGGSDMVYLITSFVPNFDSFSGSMSVTFKKKNRPMEPAYNTRGPYQVTPITTDIGARAKASQIAIRMESEDKLGEDFRLGMWQVMATQYGGRSGKQILESTGPLAPILTGILSEDETEIDLSWTAAATGTFPIGSYQLFKSVDGGSYALLTTTIAQLPRVYADTAVSAGHSYSYYVIGIDTMDNDSPQSNIVTIEIEEQDVGTLAINFDSTNDSVLLPPPDNLITYTWTGWVRFRSRNDAYNSSAYFAQGEPVVGSLCLHTIILQRTDNIWQVDFVDPCGSSFSATFSESPPAETWVFFALTLDDGLGSNQLKGYWATLGETSFQAGRKVQMNAQGVQVATSSFGFILNGGGSTPLDGDMTQSRQWLRVLSEAQLIAEKNSLSFVLATDIYSSNPLQGATDFSDESGNGRLASDPGGADSLTTTDGPTGQTP